MNSWILFTIIGVLVQCQMSFAIWSCRGDTECAELVGSECNSGRCTCPVAQQPTLGGTLCADLAPYYKSRCVEDHQCHRLFNNYECRPTNSSEGGVCDCRPGHHYFRGRCWRTADFGQTCTWDEECLGSIRNPYSMACNRTCVCADGYYLRQRGECRKIGLAIGDGCVLDEDCQFPRGACDRNSLTCYSLDETQARTPILTNGIQDYNVQNEVEETEEYNVTIICDVNNACAEPFECSLFGICLCPVGYYERNNTCLAELSSPSTEEQCVGLLARVIDGVCTCPPNFFFDTNMRDCVRVNRRISDSCVTDENCYTFGIASRCGPPQAPWGFRSCECIPEYAVWDSRREMCRLFAGIGEACEVNSDCLAGELEIQCVADNSGQGYCACPDGLTELDGLCLTTGLELGDECQASLECSGSLHSVCESGKCVCGNGYQQLDDICAPVIGGVCSQNSDCLVPDTICKDNNGTSTCRCSDGFVEHADECWAVSLDFGAPCNLTAQCVPNIGEFSICLDGRCQCPSSFHYKDGSCWPITGLFEGCSRSSQCYLGGATERVVCRNGLCQCSFDFPYSEQLHTCTSSAAKAMFSILTIAFSVIYTLTS
ncbi:prion-like-(Q/N-rich) domain-bearing protein 25 [Battus philenor]|uniref:prion-like-(Q/N-rich) domain-bearing protein 25 n=1 Tax=Battus philenor TaxID=42288 RepID=UPI0035D13112